MSVFNPRTRCYAIFGQHFAVILFSRTSVNIEPLIMVSSLISCVAAVASREMKSMTLSAFVKVVPIPRVDIL